MRKRGGFTLIELLCALAIAAIVLVAVGTISNFTLRTARAGLGEQVIREQFEQALDLFEEDVRMASGIDVRMWETAGTLEQTLQTLELHLWMIDSKNHHHRGQVKYRVGSSGNDIAQDMPPERPYPNMSLLRAQKDDTHSGVNQPVVYYLNGPSEHPAGLTVYYYNKNAMACSLADEIYSIKVVLSGHTKEGQLVQCERNIPLTTAYE